MNAAVISAIALVFFAFGYLVYSKHLERVFEVRADERVPSKEKEDGIDYVPTNRHVLFGHHYASIAGAAPIIGPAVAVVYGWLPAFLWIVFGVVFMGAMHGFATLIMSVRHGGDSVGTISRVMLGDRARTSFLVVIFALILIVIAVFARAIAGLFVAQPGTVIPINFEIVVALFIGWWCHQLFVGLSALLLGIFIAQPKMTAPMISDGGGGSVPPMFPFLFVTIACGAISGFHGLVSSGTTSKQLEEAKDARPIGYGAMLGEGLLALIATLAVGAGLGDFAKHYHGGMPTGAQGVGYFVQGASNFLTPLGIPKGAALVVVAVLVISFAATSLDTRVASSDSSLLSLGGVGK